MRDRPKPIKVKYLSNATNIDIFRDYVACKRLRLDVINVKIIENFSKIILAIKKIRRLITEKVYGSFSLLLSCLFPDFAIYYTTYFALTLLLNHFIIIKVNLYTDTLNMLSLQRIEDFVVKNNV